MMIEWLLEHQVFSGAGVVLLTALGWFFRRLFTSVSPVALAPAINITNTNTNSNVKANAGGVGSKPGKFDRGPDMQPKILKESTRILFVDDDTSFKVVKIMKAAGWPHVKIIKDVRDMEAPELLEAHVLFVDIQGVGRALDFADEGLGLSLAVKQKYPEKKVVIYSAQTDGDRFHKALNKADGSLSKNAEPYQFISLVEDLMGA